ncbi:Metallo-dependent phosphatase-like protein [Xylogone sp. PMI_703]|nr:Metallo-dependent phosphatase-like protein [Xylogone sp. PMI_703]
MTRRIVRTMCQLGALTVIALIVLFFLDTKFRVLPSAIHTYMPAHHPGAVITDITVTSCSSVNPFSSCKVNGKDWHRVEKDLYLGSGWVSSAYVHVQRKKEQDLTEDDKVVIDVTVGRLDPSAGGKAEDGESWESRPSGIWLKRSKKRHASDSESAVTAVDVLFGADAVDPREGWKVSGTSLLLDTAGEVHEARLSVKQGTKLTVTKPQPRINEHGKFKIMQLADIHLSTGTGHCRDAMPEGVPCEADPRTLDFVERLLDEEKPDLVILSGDQVNGDTAPDGQSAIFKYADLFVKRKIPYASIFGNHDDEGSLSREAQMALIETLPYSLSEAGPEEIDGVGNYYIEVLARGNSKHSAITIYLLDTHAYSPDERAFKGYDWLKKNQIDWFKNTAQGLKKAHAEYTHVHMDLAFIHIPLPEYRNPTEYVGEFREGVTAPGFNSGFRDALVEEGILMVSCGHDHANEYCALSRNDKSEPALWMCYAGGAGFGGYGGYGGYHRRVRFFDIDTNEARIKTYKRVEYGDIEKRIDEQVIVNSGKVLPAPQGANSV